MIYFHIYEAIMFLNFCQTQESEKQLCNLLDFFVAEWQNIYCIESVRLKNTKYKNMKRG